MAVELVLWGVLTVAAVVGLICAAALLKIRGRRARWDAVRQARQRARGGPEARASASTHGPTDHRCSGGEAEPSSDLVTPRTPIQLDYSTFFRRKFSDSTADTDLPWPTRVLEDGLVKGYGLSRDEARALAKRLQAAAKDRASKLEQACTTTRALADRCRVLERQAVRRAASAELDRVLGEPRAIPSSQADGYAAGQEAARARLSALIAASHDPTPASRDKRWAAGDEERAHELLADLQRLQDIPQPVNGAGEDGPDDIEQELEAVTAAWLAAGTARARHALTRALSAHRTAREFRDAAAQLGVATEGTRDWRAKVTAELRQLVQGSPQAGIVGDYAAGFDRAWRGAEAGIRTRIAGIEAQSPPEQRAAPRHERRRRRP